MFSVSFKLKSSICLIWSSGAEKKVVEFSEGSGHAAPETLMQNDERILPLL